MSVADRQKPPAGALFLDHIAHFVPDLDAAGQLLARLGFVATPRSDHRTQHGAAGTANRCVMLDEGYLEILAPTLATPEAREVRARIRRYPGVHLACFGTPAPQAEHQRLAAHGFKPLPLVKLERKVEGGKKARFVVVRVPPKAMPEGRIQYVQQLAPEVIWLPRHLGHTNGVTGLAAVFVVARDPAKVAARWARFTGLLPFGGRLVSLEASRGMIYIGKKPAIKSLLGFSPAAPALAGYALACQDPDDFAARCKREGLKVMKLREFHAVGLPRELGGSWLLGRPEALAAFRP